MMRSLLVVAIICVIGVMAQPTEHAASVPATDAPVAAAAPVCNDDIKSLTAVVSSLKSSSEAQSSKIAALPAQLDKLLAAVESQSGKLSAVASSVASAASASTTAGAAAPAAAPVDLSPVITAVEAVQAKVSAIATAVTADAKSDATEAAALSSISADVTSLKTSVNDVNGVISKLPRGSRVESLEKEVASLKTLIQQLVDSNAAKNKKEDNSQITQVLENQAEILKLYRQANEPFDWKATLGNATQTVAKYSRTAFDFGVAKAVVAWAAVVEYARHAQANPPDFKQWQGEAVKIQGEVASFLSSKGVPKDKTNLVANILLGLGASILLLVTLSIIIKFVRCICCCGRKKSRASSAAAASGGEELKEEADEPVAAPSSSSARQRKAKKVAAE